MQRKVNIIYLRGGRLKSIGQKLILISFVLAIIAAGVIFAYLQSLKEPKEEHKGITVLVATDTIPPGTLITDSKIKEIQVSENVIFADYIKDPSEIIGKYAKETILKNEGFHISKLISTGNEGLSLRIGNDHRAVSINVTGDSGVSDLIKPGDFVDIVIYLAEIKDGNKVIRPDFSKIILQNIKLLAIDKQLNKDENLKDGGEIPPKFLVTLLVSTSELEKLVLAENTGILKLALRPLNNDIIDETKGTTIEELLAELDNELENKAQESLQWGNPSNSSNSNNNEEFVNYKIKRGDTLRKISREFYGDSEKYAIIKKANNIKDGNLIITGEIIKIPVLQ